MIARMARLIDSVQGPHMRPLWWGRSPTPSCRGQGNNRPIQAGRVLDILPSRSRSDVHTATHS
jgi:hypothetical protein